MADLKRHTAKQLIAHLQAERCEWLLHLLRTFRAPYQTESEYQFWQEGFHPQAIICDEMMVQSRAERGRLRAEPQPEGCRRRAASTGTTFMRIR